jgi:hypothetical protein
VKISEIQAALKAKNLYALNIDEIAGAGTMRGVDQYLVKTNAPFSNWSDARRLIAFEQAYYIEQGIKDVGPIDGLIGPQTLHARDVWEARKKGPDAEKQVTTWRDEAEPKIVVNPSQARLQWPRQRDSLAFFGAVGTNHQTLVMPFPMRYGVNLEIIVPRTAVNKKIHASLTRIWNRVLQHYGYEKIRELRLDVYGGCFNPRSMLGGSRPSMHAYAAAWDVDPMRNQLHWGRAQASLDDKVYDPFWHFVEEEGAISLGRHANYDWMHFQFTRDFS